MDNEPTSTAEHQETSPPFVVRDGGNLIAIPLDDEEFVPEEVWASIATTLNGGSEFDRVRFLADAERLIETKQELRPGGTYSMGVNMGPRDNDGKRRREIWIQTRNNPNDPDGIATIRKAVELAFTPPEPEEE